MKIKSTYIDHVFDCDFDVMDYLIEEEGDLDSLRKFLKFESDHGGGLKWLVARLFDDLQPNHKVYRTKFARDQYHALFLSRLKDYCPLLCDVIANTNEYRLKFLSYRQKNINKFRVGREFEVKEH